MWAGTAPVEQKTQEVKFRTVPIANGKNGLVLQVGKQKLPVSHRATRWKKVIHMLERQGKLGSKIKKTTTTIKQELKEQSKKMKMMRKELKKVIKRQKELEC